MASGKKATKKAAPKKRAAPKQAVDVKTVLAWLERKGTKKNADGMARYGIVAQKVFGVSVGTLREYAKSIGKSHELALALWDTGWYEARMLSAFVDEPALVTTRQMDAWCKDFDNWAITDTICFHLFDKTPHAYKQVKAWAKRKPEFEKRASFALLASLALHDKKAEDALFLPTFALMDQAADDERNFVKKAVSWALRGVGQRSPELHQRALALGKELRDSADPTRRWIGRDAVRELEKKSPKKKVLS
jgi:3-methyladenine DNA glycosylase AlkD